MLFEWGILGYITGFFIGWSLGTTDIEKKKDKCEKEDEIECLND